jgi:hypothetical protein
MISETKVELTYKVQYVELKADKIDAGTPLKTLAFEKDQLHMNADTAMAS